MNLGCTFSYASVVMFQERKYVVECPFVLCGRHIVLVYSDALSWEYDALR